ncbi:MAG TPA: UDP-glucose/GDP-mannose dehydrogenase family protein [Steroidobacteraceae bacterium]|jgi:UDPglucose 6-dehydrogenase|nr:UDP-glucose/GDP-mannose dehydrogenase family protein [Steroidobacteraceae bacterium]
MKVTIFGSGYVGLVSAACLADAGNHVTCVDIDAGRIAALNAGEVPIYEPGLEQLIGRNRAAGRLTFTTDAAEAVAHGLFQLIAVGTPPEEDGSADLRHVLAVARTIGEQLSHYAVVVTKSTVPVGTAELVRAQVQSGIAARGAALEFDVVSNPEFLKEGAAIEDFMRPDRVVIGTDNPRTTELLRALYEPFTRNHDRLVVMDIRSAELTKYAANAMLATKISFMNELAAMAEQLGADIEKVRLGIGSDPRIGYSFIYPGIGYGGSCFPKDVKALIRAARLQGVDAPLLAAVEAVNARQKEALVHKLRACFGGELAGRTFALWGLAFKPNTDDMREAPSRSIIDALLALGASVRAYDPVASHEARRLYEGSAHAGRLVLCKDAYEAAQGADALLIATEWKEFRSPDYQRLRELLRAPLIFDGRNLYDPGLMQRLGFRYFAIGRGEAPPPARALAPGTPAADLSAPAADLSATAPC